MHRQFVSCKYRPTDSRAYTFHNDGEPVSVGDFVKVADRDGDGWKRVEVVSITDQAPTFPTKPILGKIEPEPEPEPEQEPALDSDPFNDAEMPF